jgi:hypothetical protein
MKHAPTDSTKFPCKTDEIPICEEKEKKGEKKTVMAEYMIRILHESTSTVILEKYCKMI